MNDITCDVCMDLMPLVKDGIASKDSCEAVYRHIEKCAECRKIFDSKSQTVCNEEKIAYKLKQKMRMFVFSLLMFGVFIGTSLGFTDNIFYNIVIMPIVGVLGYAVFSWKALILVPVFLFTAYPCINYAAKAEVFDFYSLIMFCILYCIFAVIGVIIAGLIHFALKKDDDL